MMYLLLRDNKQSGPYTLDDLKTKGLKAYDLVWVEGRSAAWRYPSEVDELRSFAPVVEEQPFDRFYKKPAAAGTTSTAPVAVVSSQPAKPEFSPSSTTQKRTIYVTMPGGSAPVYIRDAQPRDKQPEPVREIVREAAPVREVTPVREVAEPAPYYAVRPAGPQELSGEIVPQLPKRGTVRLLQLAGIGFGVLVLLTAGIFIGLSIQKNTSGLQKFASPTGTTDNTSSNVRTTAQQLPVPPVVNSSPSQPVAASAAPAQSGNSANPVTDRSVSKPPRGTASKPKADAPKIQAVLPVTVTDSSTAQSAGLHREAVHRIDPAENQSVVDRETIKASLANQVSVGTNKYEVGTFGGISNLQMTVTNRSAYSLDLVVVEVRYIQANKKTYKTENLYFRGISPGMALMLEAPKSSRGIQIQYKITSINSKELGLSSSGI